MKDQTRLDQPSARPGPLTSALLGLGLLTLAGAAPAATVSGSATVDWSTLNIQFVPAGASYQFYSQSSYLSGYLSQQSIDISSGDWTSHLATSVANEHVSVNLTASAQDLAVAGTLTLAEGFESFSVDASRNALLEISGSGILLVSVAGTVSSDLSQADFYTDYASSYSRINLRLSSGSLFSSGSLESWSDLWDFSYLTDVQSGLVTAALNVNHGELVSLSIFASTELAGERFTPTTVPVPASLPLLGAALLGLTGIKRAGACRTRPSVSAQA